MHRCNIADHDLETTGRPQAYVPMAVPMRLTNNDKCVAEEYGALGSNPVRKQGFQLLQL